MVTINDIAKALGVAKSTVSNALTNNRYVNPKLKQKILDKAEELEFRPNFYATSLSTKTKTNIIGLFLELGTVPVYQDFYNELIKAVVETASKEDVNTLIYYGLSTTKISNLLGVGKSPIDGAIILSPEFKDERYLKFQASQIPFVHIGKPPISNENLSYLDFDVYDLMERVLTHLFELGHKKILFLNSKINLTISKERVEAYKDILEKNNLKFEEKYIIHNANSLKEEGLVALNKIKDELEYTAVIAANDLLAKAVYEFASNNKKIIGKDISVIALGGDTYIKDALKPNLSYAHQNYQILGIESTKLLIKKIINPQLKDLQIVYNSQLFLTNSCGNVKSK